jgi:hypothetical protein
MYLDMMRPLTAHGRAMAAVSVCDASIASTAEGQRVLLGVKKKQRQNWHIMSKYMYFLEKSD